MKYDLSSIPEAKMERTGYINFEHPVYGVGVGICVRSPCETGDCFRIVPRNGKTFYVRALKYVGVKREREPELGNYWQFEVIFEADVQEYLDRKNSPRDPDAGEQEAMNVEAQNILLNLGRALGKHSISNEKANLVTRVLHDGEHPLTEEEIWERMDKIQNRPQGVLSSRSHIARNSLPGVLSNLYCSGLLFKGKNLDDAVVFALRVH